MFPQFFMPTFWMMVVAKPHFREDPERMKDTSSTKDFMEWQERCITKEKIYDIRIITGCHIVFYDAQPEFNRPESFYYIQGTFWSVNQATFLIQKMMCERQTEKLEKLEQKLDIDRTWNMKYEYIEMPFPTFPLWKSVGLTKEANDDEIVKVLNTWCLEGTLVEKIGCISTHAHLCCEHQYGDNPKCKTIFIKGTLNSQVHATREHIYKKMLITLV